MSTIQVIANKLSAVQKYLSILERYTAYSREELEEEGVLSTEEIQPLIQMTGFRNIIAHGYEHIDYDVVYDVLHGKLVDIAHFMQKIREYCRA